MVLVIDEGSSFLEMSLSSSHETIPWHNMTGCVSAVADKKKQIGINDVDIILISIILNRQQTKVMCVLLDAKLFAEMTTCIFSRPFLKLPWMLTVQYSHC